MARFPSLLCLVSVICILLLPAGISAESVFLKTGKILEGNIVQEAGTTITLENKAGKKISIHRDDTLRVLFDEEYKTKKYIYTVKKTYVTGYIVEESKEAYTVRFVLDNPLEIQVPKSEVTFVSKEPVKMDEEYSEFTAKDAESNFRISPGFETRVSYLYPAWRDWLYGKKLPAGVSLYRDFFNTPLMDIGINCRAVMYRKWFIDGAYNGSFVMGQSNYVSDVPSYTKRDHLTGWSHQGVLNAGYALLSNFSLHMGIRTAYLDLKIKSTYQVFPDYVHFGYYYYEHLALGPQAGIEYRYSFSRRFSMRNTFCFSFQWAQGKASEQYVSGSDSETYLVPGIHNDLILEYNFLSVATTVYGGLGINYTRYIYTGSASHEPRLSENEFSLGVLLGVRYTFFL